ncbi:FimV/HubP family polar landmark protein [Sulfurisoma sediminicola]|uniref:FimV/HubP family polar landmark protein n=1 Tax=Sulfurisoma sediminicola TaxID=1381557 RepID=UPI00147318B1|nr:FimV/HubP family polar landmark protein [Sulfurisoma sediminicola]
MASAAGLGKLTVLSGLGQPLRAEIDVTASREEVGSLAPRLAPAETFRQQGIEFAAALASVRMAIDKRPSGQPYIKITSDRALSEPFIDMLVELSWGSGRLVREYTFLLDPPADVTQKVVATPVALPETKVEKPVATEPAKPAAEVKAEEPKAEEAKAEPKAEEPKAEEAKAESKAEPKAEQAKAEPKAKPEVKVAAKAMEGREVKRGDTLGKIAAELKPEGVNLDQMLVALYRGNQEAFDSHNMNRLRAGKILKVPETGEVVAVDAAEARKIVVAQSSDFNAYRRKLSEAVAKAPVKEEEPKQAAAGKITPKVDDKAPAPAAGKDKLEVSRTEAAKDAKGDKAKSQARITALEEDLVARDRALKEANSRVAELEKNVGDLKKLAELKSQGGAQLQQQAQKPADAKKPEPPAPAKTAEAAKAPAAPTAAPAAPPPPPAQPAEAEKPAEPPKTAEAPKPAEPPKPAAPPPVKKKVAPPPPPPEPDFMEEYGTLVMGGGGVIALVLGYLGFTVMRKKRQAKAADTEPLSEITGTDLSANSVFGTTGGQSVDTGAALHTDFGQGPASAEEGVDPVAEADVYMAYGRDAQAEEILIEALKKEPTRLAIHVKLLEIYNARRAAKPFETLALDLKGLTGGSGPEWEKALAMGRVLDPNNVLYGAAAAPAVEQAPPPPSHVASTVILMPDQPEKMQATVTMPGQLAHMAAAAEARPPAEEVSSLDFDLDLGGPAEAAPAPGAAAPAAAEASGLAFDLDLGGPAATEAAVAPAAAGLDIDLGFGTEAAPAAPDLGIDFALDATPAPAAPAASAEPLAAPSGGLDFDFDIGTPTPAPAAAAAAPALDLGGLSLELGEPAQPAAAAPAEDNPEVATKLELAQAYEEMGDKDGARELLREVLNEGSAGQQETARARLAQLG